MKNLNTSFIDGAHAGADLLEPFGQDGSSTRIAHHFINDPKAKFILSDKGEILFQNIEAYNILAKGALSSQANGKLSYGSSQLTLAAEEIFKQIRQGRSTKLKLLKKFEDDWIICEFSSPEFDAQNQVLLTIQNRNDDLEYSFDAISRTFNLTITEEEVVRHMSVAHCPKEISLEMDISINTVRGHLKSIYGKIGTRGYSRTLRVILQLIH